MIGADVTITVSLLHAWLCTTDTSKKPRPLHTYYPNIVP